MYHKIKDQEKHPENYELKPIDPSTLEDEVFDLYSKPRQTQQTVGLYMKKVKDAKKPLPGTKTQEAKCKEFKDSPTKRMKELEKKVNRNKGFWVGRPELFAPLTFEIKRKFSLDTKRVTRRDQGIFYRPKFLELEHIIKLAKAGLLHDDEEFTDSDEEPQAEDTECLPLKKPIFKICDPCKEPKEEKKPEEPKPPKDLIDEMRKKGVKPPFKKIPTGCQCDYFGEHGHPPAIWDNPFANKLDMLRQHEMSKVLKPYKHELLNNYYAKNPPIRYMPHEPAKKTFPIYQISNL